MNDRRRTGILLSAMVLALPLAACNRSRSSMDVAAASQPQTTTSQPRTQQASAQSNIQQQQKEAEQQARPGIEKQRQSAEQEAQQNLDAEAVAAVAETRKAIAALADGKTDDAVAAIERATGKVDVLLARNPATALVDVAYAVEVIDAAPVDLQAIKARARAADMAVDAKDYPAARVLLDGLTSEIRIRTYNLPLATYPAALKEAARLLDTKQTKEATTVLLTALNTLVIVDHVKPLPILLAQAAVDAAESVSKKDRTAAQTLLAAARNEVERAKELGYAGLDPDYVALNGEISSVEKQLKGNGDTASTFSSLRQKLSSFFKRQSETKHG
jgi:hypothetical protein